MQMATRTPRTRPWTRADLARLPDDGNRYEVLDGALLVTPQAGHAHQLVAFRIAVALQAYCDRYGIAYVVGPGAVPHGKGELQPDVQVIPGTPRVSADWAELPRPMLVVEVLSDSTRRRDFGVKRDAYLRWGIAEYWVVDPDEPCVHVSRADTNEPAAVRDVLRWQPVADVPPFELSLGAVFG